MKNGVIFLFAIFVLSGCNRGNDVTDPAKGIYTCNFEDQMVWNETSRLFHDRGREGSACTKVDMSNEFSETFRLPVKYLKVKNPKKISVEGWAKVSDLKNKAVLVVCVKVGPHDVVWNGIDTDAKIFKPDVWTKLNVTAEIKDKLDPDAIIMVYGFRKSEGEVLFDDIKIEIE